jgi:hypothetical protein
MKVKFMKKIMALISSLAILMIAFSGCVGENKPVANGTEPNSTGISIVSGQSAASMSELKNLPAGFNFTGSFPLNETDIKNTYKVENSGVVAGSEGAYKSNGTDFYVDVFEFKDPEAAKNFIEKHKAIFTPLKEGSRFVEETFNGHSAVRITDYITSGGKSIPRYTYIWNNEKYVIAVFGNTADSSQVRQLAEATGY